MPARAAAQSDEAAGEGQRKPAAADERNRGHHAQHAAGAEGGVQVARASLLRGRARATASTT